MSHSLSMFFFFDDALNLNRTIFSYLYQNSVYRAAKRIINLFRFTKKTEELNLNKNQLTMCAYIK